MTSNTKKSIQKTVNKVREAATQEYQDNVPVLKDNNLASFKEAFFAYQPAINEFYVGLVNLFAKIIWNTDRFNHKLSFLKKGNYTIGYDIEEIHTNPVNPALYDNTDGAGILGELSAGSAYGFFIVRTDTTYFRLQQIVKFFHVLWIAGSASVTSLIQHVSPLITAMHCVNLIFSNNQLLECMKNQVLLPERSTAQQMTELLTLWSSFAQISTICNFYQANSTNIRNFRAVKKKLSQSAKKTIFVLFARLKQRQR